MNYCYAKQNKNSHCLVKSQFFESVVATVTVGIRCKVQCATAAATASIQIFTFFTYIMESDLDLAERCKLKIQSVQPDIYPH